MRQNERSIVVYSDGSQVDIITKIKEGKVITAHFGPGTRFLGTTPNNLAESFSMQKEFRICSNLAEREFWRINKERKRR